MRKNVSLSLLFSLFVLSACDKASPELVPCMCDSNADSSLGLFDCMCEPSKKKPVRRISYLQDKQKVRYQSLIIDEEQYNAYALLHKSRNSYAPIQLENVDFRIKKSRKYDDFNTKLGNYHFRIFGCRRETRNAFLNQGRTMQKDMHFFDVFYETLNDYYPVIVDPSNVYYPDSDRVQPEYVVTAEITDYFMNICDEFDWNEAKNKKLRNGSSEMTVVWRIMNLAKDQVYCRGTTTGYGQVMEGEPNGENLLVERAFEDALTKLPEISCVNSTLSQRVCAKDIAAQLEQRRRYENTCDTCFTNQYADELRGIEMLQTCGAPEGYETQTYITTPSGEKELVPVSSLGGTSSNELALVPCEEGSCLRSVESASGIRDTSIAIRDNCQTAEVYEDKRVVIKNEEKITPSDDFFIDIPLEVDSMQECGFAQNGGTNSSGYSRPEECYSTNGGCAKGNCAQSDCTQTDGGTISSGCARPEECNSIGSECAKGDCAQGDCVQTDGGTVSTGCARPEECNSTGGECAKGDCVQTDGGTISTGCSGECNSANGDCNSPSKDCPVKEIEVVEDGGSFGTGSSTNVEINEVNESSFASISNQFCIINNPPFEDLNPRNLYKLRASVVAVESSSGKKGAGLIIADNLVLTSADLIEKDNNIYNLTTVNGKRFKASAFRVNPSKNVAVLLLDKPTTYQPLPMSLTLPEVNKDILLTIGLLNFDDNGENYIDNEGRVVGYRWSEDRGAEIIVDTFVQTVTLGGALIDQKGNIIGIAHETKKSDTSPDLFIPIETALKSLGLEICGQKPAVIKPKSVRIYTPIADAIDNSPADKSPKPDRGLKRK